MLYETDDLEWHEVRDFFEAHGCVICGSPEMRWYQESWGALKRAGLADTTEFEEDELAETIPKLRAICLLAMYLGIYQAAGEMSNLGGYFGDHAPFSSYLHSLGVEIEAIWELARRRGILETDYRCYSDDETTDDEQLHDIAMQFVRDQNVAIFRALQKHYGGNTALFVSLLNSRLPLDEVEHSQNIADFMYPGDGRLDVLSYVKSGMNGWSWI